jgi:hypothetical protein
MAWDGEYLYLAGLFEAEIHKMTSDGQWIETIQTSLEQVTGLAWDGTSIWACDRPAGVPDRRLVRFDSDWNVVEEIPVGFQMELLDGLTWDGESFFITDCYYNMIYQLTPDGDLIWAFPGPGIAATELEWDGEYLWVSDIVSDRIYQLDLVGAPPDTVPIISVSPSSFNFTAEIEGENPPDQILSITNAGVGELSWIASEDADWLTIYPTSGTAPSEMTLSVDIAALEVGVYHASIVIESEGAWNSPVRVSVTLIVKSNVPTIALSPTKFNFNAVVGGSNPDPQNLYIHNSGGGTLNWTAEEDLDWLILSSYSGTAPSTVTLSVDITGLDEGIYYGDVVISAEDATNSPQSVQVVLNLYSEEPPGGDSVRVATVGAQPGEEVVVPICFTNTVPLGAVAVPLIYSSPEVVCDSVSFVGSRVEYLAIKPFNIDPVNRKILVAAMVTVEPYIPVGKGLFANLHFTVMEDAYPQQTVTIDTAFFPPSNVLVFVDENAEEIDPEFIAGHIVIGGLQFGDPNSDAEISISDVVYLISYVFKGGTQPYPYLSGDVNCDNQVNVMDVVYLINYLFKDGPPPLC